MAYNTLNIQYPKVILVKYKNRKLGLHPLMFLAFILLWHMFMEIKLHTWTGFSGAS